MSLQFVAGFVLTGLTGFTSFIFKMQIDIIEIRGRCSSVGQSG